MIPRKSLTGGKKKKKPAKESARESVYFDEELEPVEVEMIPEDQLELTKAELDEEFTKTLAALDPNKPSKITHFNFKKGAFESKPNTSHIAIHVSVEGVIWSQKEQEELEKLQKEKQKGTQKEEKDEKSANEDEEKENKESEPNTSENQDDENNNKDEKTENEADDDDAKEDQDGDQEDTKKEVLVKNQFNFSDRASQTFNEPLRDREVQTEPAPKSVFSQNANPSAIRDEYLKNLLKLKQQQLEEENKKKKSGFGSSSTAAATTTTTSTKPKPSWSDSNQIKHHDEGDAILHSKEMFRALKIMERVAVLNANSSSYHDFRYYSDSDYKRGSFLHHLWRFKYNEGGNKMVTCLEWNKSHLDLFGVGYGSYDFNQQTNGMICIYSLKSTAYPEKIIECESGVMCMSFHPKYSSLICVGSYDGSVAVYDIRNRDDSPIYSSENPESHHSDPVTDIKWYFDELQHDLVFYSISSDSEIKIWKMSQNELNHESFINLTSPPMNNPDDNGGDEEEEDEEEEQQWGDMPALCSCFDFNPFMEHLYLVGTEDGHIMECSKTYNDGYTKIYSNAHFMNVYGVQWNPFHSKIFLSCSEDWTIKLWEMEKTSEAEEENRAATQPESNNNNNNNNNVEPIISYDLGCSVNDVVWAPFSSTIFAAVTNDGKLHVFDLSQNKNAPLCSQQITKKSKNVKLTRCSFPVGFPLIIVGDEKGNIYALKLSPNLYLNKVRHREILKNISPTMFDENQEFKDKQKEKLINVLNVTGNKVFDVIQHFSPQRKQHFSPQRKQLLNKTSLLK